MRFLLDTNLWRYLAEAGAGPDLVRAAVKGRNSIVVVPAIVYETLATTEPVLRGSILRMLASRRWTRTMPEAYLEARELLGEIQRLRPGWLGESPDLREYRFQLADWKRDRPCAALPAEKGFWGRLVDDHELMREASRFPLNEQARAQSQAARDFVASQGDPAFPPLDDVYAAPTGRHGGGAVGPRAEAWCWAGYVAWQVYLQTPGGPHETWFLPFLQARPWVSDPGAWRTFWLEEVEKERMPRTWLRWACEYLQLRQKWSPGTPGDAQLAAHLVDADAFLPGDKRLVSAVSTIQSASWPTMATPRLVAAATAVHEVLEAVGERAIAGAGTRDSNPALT